MLVAFIGIPLLIKGLGTARFGVLTLVWVLIGYLSLFDFGLGRALTKIVAEKLGSGQEKEIPTIVWTGLFLMAVFGAIGGLVLGMMANVLVTNLLRLSGPLVQEVVGSFYVVAVSLPVVVCTTGLRGLLEAQQRFGLVNVLRVLTGILTYLSPLLVLPFSRSLVAVVGVLVAGRFAVAMAHLAACLWVTPDLRQNVRIALAVAKPLIHFGTWMTVVNIIGPLILYIDRFVIGAMVNMESVAHYTTPYEMVTRLLLVPGALIAVLLPAFSSSYAGERNSASILFIRSIKYTFLMMFPIALLIVTFARQGLQSWLGSDFAQSSTLVLQLLSVGVFIISPAQISYVFLQGIGRPDLTAKVYFIEVPLYILILVAFVRLAGINGAAAAWMLRAVLDGLLLFAMSSRFLVVSSRTWKTVILVGAFSLLALGGLTLIQDGLTRVSMAGVCWVAFIVLSWCTVLDRGEKEHLKQHLMVLLRKSGEVV